MEQINVEKIIEEIRAEIKEKGYTPSELSFADAEEILAPLEKEEYDFRVLDENLNMANRCCSVNCYQPLTGNKLAVITKKVIRKLTSFFVVPAVALQNEYNIYSVRALNQIRYYIMENAELHKRVDELEERLSVLEERIKRTEGDQV